MKKLILITVICAFIASPSFGSIITYTNETNFEAQLQSGYYLEDWNYDPWYSLEPEISEPQSFSSGVWSYDISSPGANGLSGQPTYGAVAPYRIGSNLQVSFTGTLPTAVGGIFWATDINGNNISNATVTINFANGDSDTYNDTSNYPDFTGFISDTQISSITITNGNWATMDHLYVGNVVPVPATILLGLLGLGVGGWKMRKSL